MPAVVKKFFRKGSTALEKRQDRKIISLNRRLTKMKEDASGDAIKATGLACAGGAMAGAVNAYTDDLGGMVPVASLVGIGFVLFASSGKKKIHNTTAMIGAGMLSKVAGDLAENGIESFVQGAPALAEAQG